MTKISIIIVTYKTPYLLKRCIKAIRENVKCARVDFEFIIIDNSKINRGYAKAVNLGIRKADKKSIYLLIITPDVILQKDALNKMLEFMERNFDVAIVGPRLFWPNGKPQESCFHFYKPWTIPYRRTILRKLPWAKKHLNWFLLKDLNLNQYPKAGDWIKGCAMLVRHSVLDKVGLMDERFFMYFEDVDWCRRFKNAGYKIALVPGPWAVHAHHSANKGGALQILQKQNRIHIISAIKYFWKWRKKFKMQN